MEIPIRKTVVKLARKLGMAVLISVLALVTYALWLFVQDHADFEENRAQRVARVEADRARFRAELSTVSQKTNVATAMLDTQKQRAVQVQKLIKSLHELDPGALERIMGDKEQQAAYDARVERAAVMQTETQTKIVELQREVVVGEQTRAELTRKLDELDHEESQLKTENYAAAHYLRIAWNEGRVLFYTVFFAYLFGWVVVAACLYYGWAQLAAKGRAVQLRKTDVTMPVIGECSLSLEHMLWPGERLWVRRRFIQSADSVLTRRVRLFPDWSRPLSWIACGACRLIELRNERSDGERQVVFANMNDPFAELAVVEIPEGGSFVVRAGFVMGMIADIGRRPVIRRHWRLWSWQSWVSGQFGYCEFYGPCRLVISCVSTLSGETLNSPDETKPESRRAVLAGVVGFSPQLALHPVRTESFWRYCQRRTPLFDLLVTGTGAYLTREVDARGSDGFKQCVLKPFGL